MRLTNHRTGIIAAAMIAAAALAYRVMVHPDDSRSTEQAVASKAAAIGSSKPPIDAVEGRHPADVPDARTELHQSSARWAEAAAVESGPVQNAWRSLNSNPDPASALENAARILGRSSPEYASLLAQLSAACAQANETAVRYHMDKPPASIGWALDLLQGKCSNLTIPDDLQPQPTGPGPMLKHVQGDAKGALVDSANVLARSTSALALIESREVFRIAGQLPEDALFSPSLNLSGADRELAIRNAALLLECRFTQQCGSRTVSVAAYCVTQGCSADATLAGAMQSSMSARTWDATQRVLS